MEHPPHNSYQLLTFFFHALCPDVSPTCVSSFGSFLSMFLCLRLWRRHRDSATTRQGHLPLSSFEVDGVAWILNRGNFARSTGSMSMLLFFVFRREYCHSMFCWQLGFWFFSSWCFMKPYIKLPRFLFYTACSYSWPPVSPQKTLRLCSVSVPEPGGGSGFNEHPKW